MKPALRGQTDQVEAASTTTPRAGQAWDRFMLAVNFFALAMGAVIAVRDQVFWLGIFQIAVCSSGLAFHFMPLARKGGEG